MQLGLGISTFTEMCGLAPSRVLGSLDYGAGGWENASIRMLATGKVEVVTGSSAHGQGHETAFAQIVADQLGVAWEDVEIIHGDTQSSPKGLDTYGSRSLAVGGIAIVKAAEKVVAKAKTIAAHLLEANEDDLEFENGSFSVKGSPGSSMAIGEVAFAAFMAHNLPDGVEPSLDSDATYDPENFSFPHGTHLCAMEVDTETGFTKIRKYVCVDDVGVPINPLIVEGQVHGGLAQGIAQAMFEEAVFDDAGNLTTGHVRRLHPALGGRPADVHHRPHRVAVHDEPARREGRRRGRHDRLDAGRGQRGRRRAAAVRRERRPDADDPGAGVAGDPRFGEVRPRRRGHQRLRRREYHHLGRRQLMIPAAFDYVRPSSVPRRCPRSARRARTARCWPAASR